MEPKAATEQKMTPIFSLTDLKRGETGCIVQITASPMLRHRLLDLGFRRGERVELVRHAPLNDPIEFRLSTGCVSLRRELAEQVKISRMD